LNVGTAIVLVVPIYLLTGRLGRRIDDVQAETATNVTALTNRVATFEEAVERRLDEVADAVANRIKAESQLDTASWDALLERPSRAVMVEALERADARGLLAPGRGPRVRVADSSDVYIGVDYEAPTELRPLELALVVEGLGGLFVREVRWDEATSLEEVLVLVGRAVQRAASGDFHPAAVFSGLREMFKVASSSPDCRPILEYCPPQWVVTDRGIHTVGQPAYGLSIPQLGGLRSHVLGKSWVDEDSFTLAQDCALALLNPDPF
jgi:hypothetical protein